MSDRIVILGGGIAGLASATALAGIGLETLILERDTEEPTPFESAFSDWRRRPVPQFRQSHVFLARLRNILLAENPALLDALMSAGAVELPPHAFATHQVRAFGDMPGDDCLVGLGLRRASFEWVLQDHAGERGLIHYQRGSTVTGLIVDEGPDGRVIKAIETSSEVVETPNLVVDALGRASRVGTWLAGMQQPDSDVPSSAISYYTLFYKMNSLGTVVAPHWADLGWARCSIFPGDAGFFSVTLVVPPTFPGGSELRVIEQFDKVVRAVPFVEEELARANAQPVAGSSVQVMNGIRTRRGSESKVPPAINLCSVGDSAFTLNPLYAQGVTMAFIHAQLLAEALAADPEVAVTAAYHTERAHGISEPFYQHSLRSDRALRFDDSISRSTPRGPRSWVGARIREAAGSDPVVFRAYLRGFHMIEPPVRAVARANVLARTIRHSLLEGVRPRAAELSQTNGATPLHEAD